MKLEWGRKICCPTCALPFYDLQKTILTCPNCGNIFERSELFIKKNNHTVADEAIDVNDDKGIISDFGFEEDTTEIDHLSINSDELAAKTEIEDIQLIDEE